VWPPGSADTVCPRPLLTLTFDRLTLKLVCESHLRWGTFLPNLGTLGLWVLELFAMYATDARTDRRTDGRTDKSNAYCPLPTGRGIIRNLIPGIQWYLFTGGAMKKMLGVQIVVLDPYNGGLGLCPNNWGPMASCPLLSRPPCIFFNYLSVTP